MGADMKRGLLGVCCVALSAAVLASGSSGDVSKRAYASMLVTGSITIAEDGSVKSYTLDQKEKLPPLVVAVIDKTVPNWKFSVDVSNLKENEHIGEAGLLETRMNLRLIATEVDRQHDSVTIGDASFAGAVPSEMTTGGSLTEKSTVKPSYPSRSMWSGVGGEVYVVARIGRDGKVVDAMARQVNLAVRLPRAEMPIYRADLAKAAVDAVSRWTFNVPVSGEASRQPYWYARIPITFCATSQCEGEKYGRWGIYIPGPIEAYPWKDNSMTTSSDTDAIPSGVVFQPDKRLKLLTPMGDI